MPQQQGHPSCPYFYRGTCGYRESQGSIDFCPGSPDNKPTGTCPMSGSAHSAPPPQGTAARRQYDTMQWEKANARCEREREEWDVLIGVLDTAAARGVPAHDADARPAEARMWITLGNGVRRWWPTRWFRGGAR